MSDNQTMPTADPTATEDRVLTPSFSGHFTLRVRRLGGARRPWCTFITHGIFIVGESGSSTYSARSPEASVRKAMRTVASIAAAQHLSPITVNVEVDGDAWK